MDEEITREFCESQTPVQFTACYMPDSIEIRGKQFARFGFSEIRDSGDKLQIASYQCTEPNKRGQFPVFHTVVRITRKRGKIGCVWQTTGLPKTGFV